MKERVMYTEKQLKKYPYFAEVLKKEGLDVILDSLTGIVSRAYIIGFAQSLIEEKIPFTFAILDLDNFKFINDTYGHHIGDGVLARVASDLMKYMGDYGIAGRFGGDEMLIINLRDLTIEQKRFFLNNLYENDTVLRKNIPLEGCSPFITGTLGCATYPDNAQDYDTLFGLVDKTLYRGKSKGRNCYVFYREDMHKNLEIQKIAKHGLYTAIRNLIRQFENGSTLMEGMMAAAEVLKEQVRISKVYYVGRKSILRAIGDINVRESVSDLDLLMEEDIYSDNSFQKLEKTCPVFYDVLQSRAIETILIVRIGSKEKQSGYLMFAEPRSLRIWQEDESAMLYILAKLIEYRMCSSGEELPQ